MSPRRAVRWSVDHKTVLTAGFDATKYRCKKMFGRLLQTLNHERPVAGISHSPVDSLIAWVGLDDTNGIRASQLDPVDINSSNVRASITVDDLLSQLQFVRNGVIAVALNHRVSPRSAASVMFAHAVSGKTLCAVTVEDSRIRQFAFADDKLMATCHGSGTVHAFALLLLIADNGGEQARDRK